MSLKLSDIEMRRIWLSMGFALAAASIAPAAFATPYDTLQSVTSNYNVFLLGDLGTSSAGYAADSQGAVAVVGNVYLNNASIDSNHVGSTALVVGGNLSSVGGSEGGSVFVGGNATLNPVTVSGNLVAGGNLTTTGGTVSGNVFVGGNASLTGGTTVSGSVSATGAGKSLTFGTASTPTGFYVTPTTSVNVPSYMTGAVHTSGGPVTPSPPLDLYGTATDLKNASTSLAATSGAAHVSSSGGLITLTLTGNGLNVIDLSVLSNSVISGITINVAPGVTPTGLVLNVAGDNLTFNGGTFSLGPLNATDLLFNFATSSTITMTSLAFEGSLLAPLATVNFTSGHIDGSLIAKNYTGGGEFHVDTFDGTLPVYGAAAVPEPSSWLVFAAGLAALGLFRSRRRTRLIQ